MAAKELQISDDGGTTWATLPGTSGELSHEGETIEDTIFGATFQSTEAGLITWGMNGNAFYKGFAGYNATIKSQGTSTSMTGEATSNTSGQSYQIDDTTKRVWDRSATFTINDNGVAVSDADIEEIDYLFGIVTFVSGYSVTGPITVDGAYFPLSNLGKAQSFTLTQNADAIDNSNFGSVQGNNGYRTFEPGLRTVSLELTGFFDSTADFSSELQNRNELIVEVNPDGGGDSLCRGFFRLVNQSQSGDVGALEEESVTFELNVPGNVATPFRWSHASASDIPDAVKKLLDAWEAESTVQARYLHDGANGESGTVVVTDMSLTSGLDAMNEFSVELQGSGEPTTVSL